jgi:RimJ/RimL family protein N-acetyltransferase
VELRDTTADELTLIADLESGDARRFIIPYAIERHRDEYLRKNVVYLSIYDKEEFTGFILLVLDPDGRSVEFRRIVVARPGKGYGAYAVAMVDSFCRDQLGRARIWLDVFEDNARARGLYERNGYQEQSQTDYEGRTLILYEKTL